MHPPKLRGTTEAFASRLLGAGMTKTHALESLVIGAEALGEQATVSRSTMSRICAAITSE